MAKTPTREIAQPTEDEVLKTLDSKVEVVEGLEAVTQEILSGETPEETSKRLALESARAAESAERLSKVEGAVTLPAPSRVGVHSVDELRAAEAVLEEAPQPYKHLVTPRRRMDDDRVLNGEGQLADGARYNVIVRQENIDSFTPLYVTDAVTGERLPTTCAVLEKRGERWYGQMHTRVGGAVEMHKGMDPVHLIVVPV